MRRYKPRIYVMLGMRPVRYVMLCVRKQNGVLKFEFGVFFRCYKPDNLTY